ncbi:MAG: HD domain-containing phosphohydrolase [Gallionellaceae bacterium]
MAKDKSMAEANLGRFHSLRLQLWIVIALISSTLVGVLSFTFYELNLRKHDYLILNLTGQMRVTTRSMLDQSRYVVANPASTKTQGTLYGLNLQHQIDLLNEIVTSLRDRKLSPELTGKDEAIQCTWDLRSRSQMDLTANDWANFDAQLKVFSGADPQHRNLLAAAHFISQNGESMVASAESLAKAFQSMMEGKLNVIRIFQVLAGVLSLLLLGVIAIATHRKVLKPLQDAVDGFARVEQGVLGHQVTVSVNNEIGQLVIAFNSLSERMRALFQLTDRINRGKQLDETLNFVLQEFPAFVPVDWVCVLYPAEENDNLRIERMAGVATPGLREGMSFVRQRNTLSEVAEMGNPVAINHLDQYATSNTSAQLAKALSEAGLGAALYMPLNSERAGGVMVFAARSRGVYSEGHIEFLGNIAAQIGHILERTIVVEGLVVAALQGLAKLAESRDPETGDHLVRMALYSVVLAEELALSEKFSGIITSAYVRNLHRFAPMHDIGKVGISDSILLKPGRLDEAERKEMERHPSIGGEALRRSEAQMNALGHSIFSVGIEIAECHHEKWDGSGYPAGIVGEEIPLSARIVAVADVFDALTSKRPYKDAWPVEKAISIIDEGAAKHFDPEVVSALHRSLPRVMEIYEKYKHV